MSTYDDAPVHNPARRKALSCLAAWTGAAVVWTVCRRRAARTRRDERRHARGGRAQCADVRADQRYAHRLSQGSQSRRRRQPAPRDRRHPRAAASARVRRAHRRREPSVEARGIRAGARAAAGAARRSRAHDSGRARHDRRRRDRLSQVSSITTATARPGTASTRAACTSSA